MAPHVIDEATKAATTDLSASTLDPLRQTRVCPLGACPRLPPVSRGCLRVAYVVARSQCPQEVRGLVLTINHVAIGVFFELLETKPSQGWCDVLAEQGHIGKGKCIPSRLGVPDHGSVRASGRGPECCRDAGTLPPGPGAEGAAVSPPAGEAEPLGLGTRGT